MTTLMQFQRAIEVRMGGGASFSSIEDELIEPSRLSEDAKVGALALRMVVRRLAHAAT